MGLGQNEKESKSRPRTTSLCAGWWSSTQRLKTHSWPYLGSKSVCPPGLGDVCPSNFPVPLGFGRLNRSWWVEPGFLSQGGFMPFLFSVALGVCVCVEGEGGTTQQHEGVPINTSTPSALPGPFARASQCLRRPGITRAPSPSPGSGVPQLLSPSPGPRPSPPPPNFGAASPQGPVPGTSPEAKQQQPGRRASKLEAPAPAREPLFPGRHFGSLFTFAARRSPATWLSPPR